MGKIFTVKSFNNILADENGNITIEVVMNEDIQGIFDQRLRSGTYTFESDGFSTVYNIPHGLGVVPKSPIVTRGETSDFTVFKTTVDATNIIISYENPPLTGEINLNWILTIE